MIDWHSHILPGMDDGSRNLEETLGMLDMQARQGVHTVVATPHFYANDESVSFFLERRQASFEGLKAQLPEGAPQIVLGAEVRYYQGISKMPELKKLRVEGSKVLLLEMPMGKWTEYMVRELVELSSVSDIKLTLAHMERYFYLQSGSVRERIFDSGMLMQVNASFFSSFTSKRKALSLLQKGKIQFVGSDCHNMTSRPPQIGKAFEIIERKFGAEYIGQMHEYGYAMLVTNK